MNLNDYGLWCAAAPLTAFGVMFIVLIIIRAVGVLGGAAIELPEGFDSD